jgi:hypothetical protein
VGSALDTKRDWSGLVHTGLGCAACNIKLLLTQGEIGLMDFKQSGEPPGAAIHYRLG